MFVSAKRLPCEFANVYVDEEWVFLTTKLELTRGFMFGKDRKKCGAVTGSSRFILGLKLQWALKDQSTSR